MESYTKIYISLGSNIKPTENLTRATATLFAGLTYCEVSSTYRSQAMGMNGPDFCNSVVTGNTQYDLDSTLQWLKEIEEQQGRVRSKNKFTDRTLDLDLLFFGNVSNGALPHKEVISEAYVLQPLHDIAPSLIHPGLKKTIDCLHQELLQKAPEKFNDLTRITKQQLSP